MDTTSPTKRRVLGALDPNAASPRTPQHLFGAKRANLKTEPVVASNISPSRSLTQPRSLPSPPKGEGSPDLRKRPMQQMAPPHGEEDERAEPAKKRPCLRGDPEEDVPAVQESPVSPVRHRSSSPETSSVFDNSINDISHATAITEPEEQAQPGTTATPFYAAAAAAVAASGPVRRGTGSRLMREQARQNAETIRLRLGLAAYKVRTGQTDVPLEHLQVRPMVLPRSNSNIGTSSRGALPPTASLIRTQQQVSSQQWRDYRRALPNGISISAFEGGDVGARRSSQEAERHEQQRRATTTSPAKHHAQQPQSDRSDTMLKSSPPVLPSAPAHLEEEDDLPDGLPSYRATSATIGRHSTYGGDSQSSSATTVVVEDDDVLPDAASGLLSLARG
ncbi:hypothetical protein V8F20_005037 [Naviculisporaceae sp. PSN 640]